MPVRIPAWKIVGLRLKTGSGDEHDKQPRNGGQSSTAGHRPLPADVQNARPSKRKRYENSIETNETQSNSNSNQNKSATEDISTLKRKKSVSFTNDTKLEDGDTRTTIDFPPGTQGSSPSVKAKASLLVQSTKDAVGADVDVAKSSTKGKQERQTGPKQNRSSVRKPKNALEYLNQFNSDRNSWKFNKNQDSWILSHALSTNDIPNTYNEALCAYIHGLPAKAGARARLTEQCKETLQSRHQGRNVPDEITPSNRDQCGNLLLKTLDSRSPPEYTDEFKEWLSNESRPILLLYAMGVHPVGAGHDTDRIQIEAGMPLAKAKKNKSRTLAAVDLSSSSDESSSDESLDAGSKERVSKGRNTNSVSERTTQRKDASAGTDNTTSGSDETSSSESSSDSE